jgi:hypothetical protein
MINLKEWLDNRGIPYIGLPLDSKSFFHVVFSEVMPGVHLRTRTGWAIGSCRLWTTTSGLSGKKKMVKSNGDWKADVGTGDGDFATRKCQR